MNPWSVDWTDNGGVHHTDPLDINCRCFDPEKTIVLNPAAWDTIPDGRGPRIPPPIAFSGVFDAPVKP